MLEAMAEDSEMTLIDVADDTADVTLEEYDAAGFASGIYGFVCHKAVAAFARRHLPRGKKILSSGCLGSELNRRACKSVLF